MSQHNVLHRSLQRSPSQDHISSLFFPYLILGIVTIITIGMLGRYAYVWVGEKFFGMDFSEPDPPLSAEEILANLTDEQRRDVLKTILSKVCKPATEDHIPNYKPSRRKSKTNHDGSYTEILPVVSDIPEEITESVTEDLPSSHPEGDDEEVKRVSVTSNNDNSRCEGLDAEEANGRLLVQKDGSEEEDTDGRKIDTGENPKSSTMAPKEVIQEPIGNSFDIEQGAAADVPFDNNEDNIECPDTVDTVAGGSNCSLAPCQPCAARRHSSTQSLSRLLDDTASDSNSFTNNSSFMNDSSFIGDHDVCPICLGAYKAGSMLLASPHCSHIFHGDCILEWLAKSRDDCPICRVQMVTQEEMVASAMALVHKASSKTTKPVE